MTFTAALKFYLRHVSSRNSWMMMMMMIWLYDTRGNAELSLYIFSRVVFVFAWTKCRPLTHGRSYDSLFITHTITNAGREWAYMRLTVHAKFRLPSYVGRCAVLCGHCPLHPISSQLVRSTDVSALPIPELHSFGCERGGELSPSRKTNDTISIELDHLFASFYRVSAKRQFRNKQAVKSINKI